MNTTTMPLTVPKEQRAQYKETLDRITRSTGRLLLFAGDQKMEHLNADFHGDGIPKACGDPEHLFKIASAAQVSVFATQLGLVSRYGGDYKKVNYVIKLNSKTNLVPAEQSDPMSLSLATVEDVVTVKEQSDLNIVGVGYTVYLGSAHEAVMLSEASDMVIRAHEHGLLAILWMYPRGRAVANERTAEIIAGAAGVGAALGADFVKVNPPEAETTEESAELLKQATRAAGRTGVICSGGKKIDEREYLQQLYEQITIGETAGCALGRNIFQRPLHEAISFTQAVASMLYQQANVEAAYRHYEEAE